MPVYDGGIRAYIGFLVDTVKARGGTTSRLTRRGAVIRCLTLRRQVVTTARRRRGRSTVDRTGNDAWRNQRRIATPPDCTCTKAIDNVAADRTTGSKRACRTRMRDVNSAAASPENFQFASIRGHQIVHPHNFSSEKKTILRLQWSKTRNTCRADCKRCNWYGQIPGQYDMDFCAILFTNINVGHLYMY